MTAKTFIHHWTDTLIDTLKAERAKAGSPFTLSFSMMDAELHLSTEGRALAALQEVDRLRDARWVTN